MAKVVDVCGSAGEVHEAGDTGDFGVVGEFLLEPVLDRLDVVIDAGFDLFYRFTVDDREVANHSVELPYRGGRKGGNVVERLRGAKRFEPFDFDQNAVADQAEFAEVIRESGNFVPVAAIERGQGGEIGKRHHPSG